MSETVFVTIQTDRDIPYINVRGPISYPLALPREVVENLKTLGYGVVEHPRENIKVNVLGQRVLVDGEVTEEPEVPVEPTEPEETPEQPEETPEQETEGSEEEEEVVTEPETLSAPEEEEEEEFHIFDEEEYASWANSRLIEYIESAIDAGLIEPQGSLKSKNKEALLTIIRENLLDAE